MLRSSIKQRGGGGHRVPLSKLKNRERYEGKGGERGGKRCPCIPTRTRRPRRGAKKTEREKGMAAELIKREDISMEICSGDEEIREGGS